MILQSLVEYYKGLEEEGKVTAPGWCQAKVAMALELSESGELEGVTSMKHDEPRGKKTIEVLPLMKVPEQGVKTSGISPNFLCDNSSYLLGIDTKGKPERAKKCFLAAKELHLAYLADVHSEAAEAVKQFFQNWNPETAEKHPVIAANYEELSAASNLVFYLGAEGCFVQEDEEIQQAWEKRYREKDGGKEGLCLVTGERGPIARIHGKIKGVPGAQSSGASLVGFNAPAFCSHGKEQSYNAPVSEYAAYAYTTALNYLISNRDYRSILGNTMVVYWAESGEEVYQKVFSDFAEPTKDNQDTVRGIFKNLEKGWEVDVDAVLADINPEQKFCILGLGPNAGRLAVRFFYQDGFGNILRHLKEHYDRMEVVRPASDIVEYLGVWRMLQEIANKKSKDKKPPDHIAGNTFRAILSGGRYPESLYQAVLQRIRAEQDDSDAGIYKITRGRAAIIKAYLMRNTKIMEEEELTVSLNENSQNVPYNLGRMFAVLEHIQEESNWPNKLNATIKDRYFNSACTMPASIFPTLLRLKNSHMKKIAVRSKGTEIWLEKQLGDLQDKFTVEEHQTAAYPRRLTLEEQGMFILGYYHQTRARFTKKDKEEE
ncbi:type I-C CRISPR-associated protein Cas8c/Csd1 [Ihubacter sp. rT4E-8]|uniref:type I-C CRISPR-associated protein Cas8c/Csd1 n=1 Tax=Ihubacter sp. rT4E-8 TaxID=3242369 RepID=UPI003CF103B8